MKTSAGYPNHSGGLIPPKFAATRVGKKKNTKQATKPKSTKQRKRK